MAKYGHLITVIFLSLLLIGSIIPISGQSCKNIVACGDATDGDYNLLLKVRDPSRPELQVLCIVPEGYDYSYHHPRNGNPMDFTVNHKFIGVTTIGDTIPNIVKAGMTLSDAGLAYGDADTGSNWMNLRRYAWDDFDWIRYACQDADNENEAIDLLTKGAVDDLHATAVSENLFVVGPAKAAVIEADAVRYDVQEFDDGVLVMSNYPNELWKSQIHKKLPIARSFDTVKEQYVRRGRTIRLGSIFGVKIVDIGEDYIIARQVPFVKLLNGMILFMGEPVRIELGERETVGDYSVRLLDVENRKAQVSVSYVFKAWEDAVTEHVQQKYGSITVQDMINWSRLHDEDLEGLRPMCEDRFSYESAMVYKIPEQNYETLSSGWFAANHACSSIYVPVHIADNDIYDPYKTGGAAELSLELLEIYGHDELTIPFSNTEQVFLNEMSNYEAIAQTMIDDDEDVSEFLTEVDMSMQQQAYLTEYLWKESGDTLDEHTIGVLESIWHDNYSASLEKMDLAIDYLENIEETNDVINIIGGIALSICDSQIQVAQLLEKDTSNAESFYRTGKKYLTSQDYGSGFDNLQNAFQECRFLIFGEHETYPLSSNNQERKDEADLFIPGFILLVFVVFLTIFYMLRKQD